MTEPTVQNLDTPPTGYRKGLVTMWIDDYSGRSRIPAYLPDPPRYWNGWACPVFPLDTFTQHAEAWRLLFPPEDNADITVSFNEDGRLSVIYHYDGEEPVDYVENVTIDGQEYVGAGAYCLVWEEVDRVQNLDGAS